MVSENLDKEGKIKNLEIDNFLKLLKTNPEAVEYHVIKNEYKKLLEYIISEVESCVTWENARKWGENLFPYLLNMKILDKTDKIWYKNLLEKSLKIAYTNEKYGRYILSNLLKIKLLDKTDRKWYKQFIGKVLDIYENMDELRYLDMYWVEDIIAPALSNCTILDKNDKEWYKKIFEDSISYAKYVKTKYYWVKDIIPSLLKCDMLDKNDEDDKEWYKKFFEDSISYAINDDYWAEYIIPSLLKCDMLDKNDEDDKEWYKKNFEDSISYAKYVKTKYYWVKDIIPSLLKCDMLDKNDEDDKEWYKKFFEDSISYAINDDYWAKYIIPSLLKCDMLDKNDEDDKEWYKPLYKKLLLDKLNNLSSGGEYVICRLLNLGVLDKNDYSFYERLLEYTLKNLEENPYLILILETLSKLKIGILNKNDIIKYKKLLEESFIKSEVNHYYAAYILPALINLKIVDKNKIKKKYKNLIEILINKYYGEKWADRKEYYFEGLLNCKVLNKDDKEWYKLLLEDLYNKEKNLDWPRLLPIFLNQKILDKNDKEWYKKFLEKCIDDAKNKIGWAKSVIPILLDYKILDKGDRTFYINMLKNLFDNIGKHNQSFIEYVITPFLNLKILDKDKTNNIVLKNLGLYGLNFLRKNIGIIKDEDITFMIKSNTIFSEREMKYIYSQEYEYFISVIEAVNKRDFKKIWEIKKESYKNYEKEYINEMEEFFGESVWTYFVDKVPGNKNLINRFREPHNALDNYRGIIELAQILEEKGVNKKYFIKNYLGVAGDRNNGYQQLNNFIHDFFDDGNCNDWKEIVLQAMDMDEFKNNIKFIELANKILEKDRTGELYKNLDELEQINVILKILRNKKSLIELQKLKESKDVNDEKLYEYFSNAICHPRTRPIIIKMYKNPLEFLRLDDTTVATSTMPKDMHMLKKPSNMVENFKFLDFDARDLVSCLPLGIYDKLSYFKPFEMKFYIKGNEVYTREELETEIKNFIELFDHKKISVIVTKFGEKGDEIMSFKERMNNKEEFIRKIFDKYGVEELIEMFRKLGYCEFNKYSGLKKMTAKISPKSDPNNRFNGFNCDSLAEGHGKKVVAMFNPYCTDFCIYEGDQDSKQDNLKVTSWVTLNRAIPEKFTTLMDKLKFNTTRDIVSVLGDSFEDYREPIEYVITMDNIEANPNFSKKNAIVIRTMYEKFFSKYVNNYPLSPNEIPINTSKFYSGESYNVLQIFSDNEKIANKSLPIFTNAYSDNSGEKTYQGNLNAGKQIKKAKKVGIYPLSIEDVIQVSYMEGKIYPSSMKTHLGTLQHEITASILNNALKGRPNLSFTWYNEEGIICGYILAYQGKMEDGTPGIYISDFTVDEKERGTAGLEMIRYWMKEAKEKYPDMPVFTRARENTSYRMIKASAEEQGYEIVQNEIMENWGGKWHRLVMNPKC